MKKHNTTKQENESKIYCFTFLAYHSIRIYSHVNNICTVEPRYTTRSFGTMKKYLIISDLSLYQCKKQRNVKNWDQQNYLVIRWFCYIRPLYNQVALCIRVTMLEIFNVKIISSHLILSNHDIFFSLLHLRISIPGWPLTIIS